MEGYPTDAYDHGGAPEAYGGAALEDTSCADDNYPDSGLVSDVLAVHEAPAFIPDRAGDETTYGDAGNLPTARILQTIQWKRDALGRSPMIAAVPGHPECVVRIQNALDIPPPTYNRLVATGKRHFDYLTDHGIAIPAQRFVTAPDIRAGKKPVDKLYTITEYVQGALLAEGPETAHHALPIIDAVAQYQTWALEDPDETHYLFDKGMGRQYTITDGDRTIMHDVGLDFSDPSTPTFLRYTHNTLCIWARNAGIDHPESLQRLGKLIMRRLNY